MLFTDLLIFVQYILEAVLEVVITLRSLQALALYQVEALKRTLLTLLLEESYRYHPQK